MILLRSALFALWFYLGTFVVTVGGLPVLRDGPERAMRIARRWAALMLAGLRVLCGIRWEVTGLEHLPAEGPALIASMHQSAFDTLIWIVLAPRFTYVFKRELADIPVFARYLRLTGMIPVDRRAGGAAMRALLRAADHAAATGRQIVIFPQGTRVAPGAHADLAPGVAAIATRIGLPVIPVLTDSGLLWGRRAFLKRPGLIRVAMQPPLPPGLTRGEMMDRLAAVFADAEALLAAPCPVRPGDNSVSEASPGLPAKPS